MISLDPNFRDLLICLNSAGVRYLVVGGYAVNVHGYHRNTKDLDIWIATDPKNARAVAVALRAFGFAAKSVKSSMFRDQDAMFTFGREPFRVDILTNPSDIDFEACYARRMEQSLGGLHFPVIGFEDLLKNKAASGRPQDLSDLQKLQKKSRSRAALRRQPRARKDKK